MIRNKRFVTLGALTVAVVTLMATGGWMVMNDRLAESTSPVSEQTVAAAAMQSAPSSPDIERYLISKSLDLSEPVVEDPPEGASLPARSDALRREGLRQKMRETAVKLAGLQEDRMEFEQTGQTFLTPRQAAYMAELRSIDRIQSHVREAGLKLAPIVSPMPATAPPP